MAPYDVASNIRLALASGSYMVAEEGANLNAWNGVFDFKVGGFLRAGTRLTLYLLPLLLLLLLLHGVLRTSTRPTMNSFVLSSSFSSSFSSSAGS